MKLSAVLSNTSSMKASGLSVLLYRYHVSIHQGFFPFQNGLNSPLKLLLICCNYRKTDDSFSEMVYSLRITTPRIGIFLTLTVFI